MRITNSHMTRTYLTNANNALELYSDQNTKIETGRAFSRISQNVSAGRKALTNRTQMYRNEQYQKNVSSASEQLTTAETALREIDEQLSTVNDLALKACNGTNTDETSRKIFAATLSETKKAIVDTINCKHLDKYIFAGTNNSEAPFSVDADGEILFNGTKVSEITEKDGVYYDADGEEVKMSGDTYVDIGLGLKLTGGSIDESSAFKMSFSGLEALGFGSTDITYTDADGNDVTETVSNNVYDILTQMQGALDDNDTERLSALNDHLTDQFDNLLTDIAKLGVKSKYLETTKSKLVDQGDQYETMQKDIEGINDTDEIVKWNEYKYTWQLTLQFGSSVLPQSLMDYIK